MNKIRGRITTYTIPPGDEVVDEIEKLVVDHGKEFDELFEISFEEDEMVFYYYELDEEGEKIPDDSGAAFQWYAVVAPYKKKYDYEKFGPYITKESQDWLEELKAAETEEADHLS